MMFRFFLALSLGKSLLGWFTTDRLVLMGCAAFLIVRPVFRWYQRL